MVTITFERVAAPLTRRLSEEAAAERRGLQEAPGTVNVKGTIEVNTASADLISKTLAGTTDAVLNAVADLIEQSPKYADSTSPDFNPTLADQTNIQGGEATGRADVGPRRSLDARRGRPGLL